MWWVHLLLWLIQWCVADLPSFPQLDWCGWAGLLSTRCCRLKPRRIVSSPPSHHRSSDRCVYPTVISWWAQKPLICSSICSAVYFDLCSLKLPQGNGLGRRVHCSLLIFPPSLSHRYSDSLSTHFIGSHPLAPTASLLLNIFIILLSSILFR